MIENSSRPTQISSQRWLFGLLIGLLWHAFPLSAQPKIPTISAENYRAKLQVALKEMRVLQKQRPRRLGPILNRLDAQWIVRRADGQTQAVNGNSWSRFKLRVTKPADARREEVIEALGIAQSQLNELDQWTRKPYYTPVDAGKIVAQLVDSGQIRVEPFWWQTAINNVWKSISDAWAAIIKWINGLFPNRPAPSNIAAPSDKWLWFLFYAVVVAILTCIIWFLFRIFGGRWINRRATRRNEILESEDAQLLLLPPDELRLRAADFAAQGQFREALRHRYLALLLTLDARGIWRYDARRTNWEHIAVLRRQENKRDLVPDLSDLTRRFDRVRYGGASCDATDWQNFDLTAQNFEARSAHPEKIAELAR